MSGLSLIPSEMSALELRFSQCTLLFSSLFPYHNSHPLHSLHLSNGFKSWIRCNSLHRSLQSFSVLRVA
ncbi:hypothetical protein MRB53_033818 [Persea americana]|uniref:Uncharacterized protein n=1 Tax=Persea americana TaxID=3435 RepID=A0ACC2KWB5_PERAE|nr:hypothetical protein MRB53_033818 [Persea americana]